MFWGWTPEHELPERGVHTVLLDPKRGGLNLNCGAHASVLYLMMNTRRLAAMYCEMQPCRTSTTQEGALRLQEKFHYNVPQIFYNLDKIIYFQYLKKVMVRAGITSHQCVLISRSVEYWCGQNILPTIEEELNMLLMGSRRNILSSNFRTRIAPRARDHIENVRHIAKSTNNKLVSSKRFAGYYDNSPPTHEVYPASHKMVSAGNLEMTKVQPDTLVHIYRDPNMFIYCSQVLCDHATPSPAFPVQTDGK